MQEGFVTFICIPLQSLFLGVQRKKKVCNQKVQEDLRKEVLTPLRLEVMATTGSHAFF